MKIVILDGHTINPGDNPWIPVEKMGECSIYERTPPELVLDRAGDAEIILTSKVKMTEAVITALPKLQYISLLATGYNNVDVAAAARRGIPVSNVPAYSTESVVQTAFANSPPESVSTMRLSRRGSGSAVLITPSGRVPLWSWTASLWALSVTAPSVGAWLGSLLPSA